VEKPTVRTMLERVGKSDIDEGVKKCRTIIKLSTGKNVTKEKVRAIILKETNSHLKKVATKIKQNTATSITLKTTEKLGIGDIGREVEGLLGKKEIQSLKLAKGTVSEQIAKPIAGKIAEKVLVKQGIEVTPKLRFAFARKLIPWIRRHPLISALVGAYGISVIYKNLKTDKHAESTIPQGEYYHPKVGWYS